MFRKIILWSAFTVLFAACGASEEHIPTVEIESTPTPLPRPTATVLAPPTPVDPFISLQGEVDIQISPLFGKGTISQLVWSRYGTIIAVGGSQGIRLYTADTLEELRFIPTDFLITSIAFSPDGTVLASGSADLSFSRRTNWRRNSPWGSENNFVQLWDVQTGNLLETINTGFSYVTTITFSPDGSYLASGSMYPDDNAIRIWKLASVFEGDLVPWQLLKEHTRAIFGIDFSPNGKILLSGSGDNTSRLLNVEHQTTNVLMYRTGAIVKVFAVDYSPVMGAAGEQLVALGGSVFQGSTPTELLELWDASSGELVLEFHGHMSSIDSVAFSPDGKLLASGGSYPDNNIHLWDTQSGKLLRVLEGHSSGVRSVAFSPDGKSLASNGWDAMLYFWDVETGELKRSNDEHTSVVWSAALSPDGQILATGGDEGFIRLWDVESGQKLDTLNAHSSRVTSLAFNTDGTTLIAGTDEPDFNIQLWDVQSGEQLKVFDGHENFVQVMALSPDGKTLASGGALGDNAVRLWDIATGNLALHVIEGHTRSVKSLAFNADGQVLATGDGTGMIRLIDVATGQVQRTFEGQDCAINALRFDPSSGSLISGGCNGIVRLWDVQTGELLRELTGPDEFVTELRFYPATQELVIGFVDGSIWFWNPLQAEPSVRIDNTNLYIQALQFQPEKMLAVMDSGGGLLRLWTIQR